MLKPSYLCFFAAALFPLTASASIIITLSPSGSTTVDTGLPGPGKTIDFYIGQDALSSDALLSIAVDFLLQSGVATGGTISATGMAGTPGYFGAGNLLVSNLTPNAQMFAVGQDFTDGMQPLLNDPLRERWFTLELDTTGLAGGSYTITGNGLAFDPVFAVIPANADLTFTVAVPEPASCTAAAVIGGVCALRMRKRKKVGSRLTR